MKLGKLETRELIDDSAMNESYKTLRTNLLYTSDLKVISLTSTVANEGKTTTAYYLAKSYAELGKKVLLMDCEMCIRDSYNTHKSFHQMIIPML